MKRLLSTIKTYEQLMNDSLQQLESVGISSDPGGIARLFLSIINKNISDLHESLSLHHANAFVSTAYGTSLDAIGLMLGCERLENETDDDYRYRITKQTLSTASANETSIRLAALSVNGVQDVVLKPYALGAGSFALMVITDSAAHREGDYDRILNEIEIMVKEKIGYGIKFSVIQPKVKEVTMSIKLILKDTVTDAKSQSVRFGVRDAIQSYLSGLSVGEQLIIDELTKIIMNVDPSVVSYICEDLKINGDKVMFVNQSCEWNERFSVSASRDGITVS